MELIRKISYIRKSSRDCHYDIVYALREKFYEEGDLILRQNEKADCIIMIQSGCCEVFTQFEGNEFIIDRLYPGSVINHRALIMEDKAYASIRCTEFTKTLMLNKETIEDMQE